MLKVSEICISIFLIVIILLQIPQDIVGLSSFASKTDILGSPRSAQRFLKILTIICILVYFGIGFQLNF